MFHKASAPQKNGVQMPIVLIVYLFILNVRVHVVGRSGHAKARPYNADVNCSLSTVHY